MAPEMMARICRLEGMRFIHLSTDYVLDGRREGLKTEEEVPPVNVYGESKLEAEFRVREEMPDALVARVSWVFGNPGRPSFLEMVLRRAMKREPLAAVADKWSMPTWVEDLCVWLRFLAYESGASGVLHLCQSGEPVSWHSYAVAVLKCAVKHGLLPSFCRLWRNKSSTNRPVSGDARPRHTAMSCERLSSLMKKPVRAYEEAIDMAVARYAADQPFSPAFHERFPQFP